MKKWKSLKILFIIWLVLGAWVYVIEGIAQRQAYSFCEWASSGKSFAEITQAALQKTAEEDYHAWGDEQGVIVSVRIHWSYFDRKSYVDISQEVEDCRTCDGDASASVSVMFMGVPPFSRHVCTIKVSNGKVINAEYGYAD